NRRGADREASPRRAETRPRPGEARGRWIPAASHLRGGDGAAGAVRVERAYRRRRQRDAGLAPVRRPRQGHHHSPGLLIMRRLWLALCLVSPLQAQKRAITFDDYINLPVVSDPQLSPDAQWVAYTVTTPSLKENRGLARIWLANVASGDTRQLTQGG